MNWFLLFNLFSDPFLDDPTVPGPESDPRGWNRAPRYQARKRFSSRPFRDNQGKIASDYVINTTSIL